jgi:hypothetical protein
MPKETFIKFETSTNPVNTIINLEDAIVDFLDSMHDFYDAKGILGKEIYGAMCKNHAILLSSMLIEDGKAFNLVSKVLDLAYQSWKNRLKEEN